MKMTAPFTRLILNIFLLCWLPLIPSIFVEAGDNPNIIVFLVDDLGFDDVGGSGNTLVESPVLDQLKNESVYFDQFMVAPACAPTRASFLTGRDYWRAGVTHVHGGGDYLHLDEVTIAEVLQANGYRTGMWGKWHSGKSPAYFPWQRGFDEAYYGELYKHEGAHGWMNGEFLESDKWSPELITDFALDFISEDSDKPFFAFINFLAVHEPIFATDESIEHFASTGLSPHLSTLYAMVQSIDFQVGRVLNFLKETGVDENTIIVFFSDNGPTPGNTSPLGNWSVGDWSQRNQWNQFRGEKGQIWENGIHVPLYVKWADECSFGVNHQPVCVADLFPTLIDLAGLRLPEHCKDFDGVSFSSLLLGKPDKAFGQRSIIGHSITPKLKSGKSVGYHPVDSNAPEQYPFEMQTLYIRKNNYKLLLNPDGTDFTSGPQWFMFDLSKDPREQRNILTENQGLFDVFKTELENWYTNLWQEENRFQRPIFFIGLNKDSRSKINAFGASRLLGDGSNENHYLSQLSHAGDGAAWDVEVLNDGCYSLEIDHMDDVFPDNMVLEVSIAGQSKNFVVGNNKLIYAGQWQLPKGESTLRMRVLSNDSSTGETLDKIRHLTFYLTSSPRDGSKYPW